MSRSYKPCELTPGMRVLFADGNGETEGTINGAPWVVFDGVNAVARVPVYVSEGDRCIDVAGANILCTITPLAIELAEQYSVRA